MKLFSIFLFNLVLVLITQAWATEKPNAQAFSKAKPEKKWSFPRDHGEHPSFKTEWWYYTGNLSDKNGRRFGYQLTFFRSALGEKPHSMENRKSAFATNQLYLAHFAVSDVQSEKHYSAERFARGHKKLASVSFQPFSIFVDGWRASGKSPGKLTLKAQAASENFELHLDLNPAKAFAFQGKNGFSPKGFDPSNASHYYSFTRLRTQGTIRIGNQEFSVTGSSWMDHEFSTSLLERHQSGWDWFSIQLDDQRELMLFQLRDERKDRKNYYSGRIISADGSSRSLNMDQASFQPLKTWRSQRTQTNYPIAWSLKFEEEEIDLTVEAAFSNQEMKTSIPYWEGAIKVRGQMNKKEVSGLGFMELTGYGESIQKRFR